MEENKQLTRYYNSQNLTLQEIGSLGKVMAGSGFFQDTRQANQAVVKIIAGQEMGFSPIVAMTKINIIKGKICLSAELMASMIKRHPDYDYKVVELTDEKCVIQFYNKGEKGYLSTFTIEDAKRAGIYKQDSGWEKYPRAMLFSRDLSQGARIECPHLLNGAYTAEEMGAEVTEEGEIISVETVEPEKEIKQDKPKKITDVSEKHKSEPKSQNGEIKTDLDKITSGLVDYINYLYENNILTRTQKDGWLNTATGSKSLKQVNTVLKNLQKHEENKKKAGE